MLRLCGGYLCSQRSAIRRSVWSALNDDSLGLSDSVVIKGLHSAFQQHAESKICVCRWLFSFYISSASPTSILRILMRVSHWHFLNSRTRSQIRALVMCFCIASHLLYFNYGKWPHYLKEMDATIIPKGSTGRNLKRNLRELHKKYISIFSGALAITKAIGAKHYYVTYKHIQK